ncbi:hypothetical protein H072_9273 [Dactylellina haptotyla CBS 200.50]|uniref:Uncharacterized protein n=1 Tax=Dactylellina haptotyla (strain CBS 200.50) TaxID=1284197 RepID=S8A283_DACHA|nr:hypothetical protein H072_9273 [Dactylellina haptotyla CBS 200.50]
MGQDCWEASGAIDLHPCAQVLPKQRPDENVIAKSVGNLNFGIRGNVRTGNKQLRSSADRHDRNPAQWDISSTKTDLMAPTKSAVRTMPPTDPSTVLKSHWVLAVIILSGIVGIFGGISLCKYILTKTKTVKTGNKRREPKHYLGVLERGKRIIFPMRKIKTNATTGTQSSEGTLPPCVGSPGTEYGVVGFGNCQAECLESIAGSSGAVLPGDISVPDDGALAARGIQDTSKMLTPPMKPETCKFTTIKHWYHPASQTGRTSGTLDKARQSFPVGPGEDLGLDGEEEPLALVIPRWQGVEDRKHNSWEKSLLTGIPSSLTKFGKTRRSSLGEKDKVTGQPQSKQTLRKFGDTEDRTPRSYWEVGNREHDYFRRSLSVIDSVSFLANTSYETIKLDAGPESVETAEGDRGYDGYRESIISGYGKSVTDGDPNGSQDPEAYLWKALPKPPAERV